MSLYLIAHKVRGEPAFDVAIQADMGTESDPGPWWIIPTSGHRAYPYWHIAVDKLLCTSSRSPRPYPIDLPDIPANLPDHYAHVSARHEPAPRINPKQLLEKLGLRKPLGITRRL